MALVMFILSLVIVGQAEYTQGQGAAQSLLFPFLPDTRGGVASTTTLLSHNMDSSDPMKEPSLHAMTPIYRTLPFQLVGAGHGGARGVARHREGGRQSDPGDDRQSAHALQMIRQLQVDNNDDEGGDEEQMTVGQMMKMLSSINNKMKQSASKEVKWGFM